MKCLSGAWGEAKEEDVVKLIDISRMNLSFRQFTEAAIQLY